MLGAIITGMTTFEHASNSAFIEARMRYRQGVASYTADWPRLSANAGLGELYERPSLEFFLNRSCRDLLINIGMRQIATDAGRDIPPPELVRWKHPPIGLPISDSNSATIGPPSHSILTT